MYEPLPPSHALHRQVLTQASSISHVFHQNVFSLYPGDFKENEFEEEESSVSLERGENLFEVHIGKVCKSFFI